MEKKPCGCGNKKQENNEAKKIFSEPPIEKVPFKNAISMVQGYAMSMVSRGFSDKKTDKTSKQLRVLSCFGNKNTGGELPPCSHLKPSSTDGKFYCGGCGCGDRKQTWLNGNDKEYSKLDYPKVNCPLKMPGFTNYEPSSPLEAKEPQSRKNYIEKMNFDAILRTDVTEPEMPKEISEMFDKILEAQKNKNQP
jgi:hypothetical protein